MCQPVIQDDVEAFAATWKFDETVEELAGVETFTVTDALAMSAVAMISANRNNFFIRGLLIAAKPFASLPWVFVVLVRR